MTHGKRRWTGPVLLTAGVLALAGLLPALALISRDAWLAVLAPGPADLGALATALAGPVALALAGWLLMAVLVSVADALAMARRSRRPHTSGRQPGARSGALAGWPSSKASWSSEAAWLSEAGWVRRLAPAVLRHGVAALIGVSLLSSPAMAAGPADPSTSGAVVTVVHDLSPTWPPVRAEVTATTDDHSRVVPGYVDDGADASRSLYTAAPSPASAAGDARLRGWLPSPPMPPGRATPAVAATAMASGSSRSANPGSDLSTIASTGQHRRADDDGQVVVRRGDSLWSIAARSLGPSATPAQVADEWPRWFSANAAVIGSDPNLLRPGQRLSPPAPSTSTHPGTGPGRDSGIYPGWGSGFGAATAGGTR